MIREQEGFWRQVKGFLAMHQLLCLALVVVAGLAVFLLASLAVGWELHRQLQEVRHLLVD